MHVTPIKPRPHNGRSGDHAVLHSNTQTRTKCKRPIKYHTIRPEIFIANISSIPVPSLDDNIELQTSVLISYISVPRKVSKEGQRLVMLKRISGTASRRRKIAPYCGDE